MSKIDTSYRYHLPDGTTKIVHIRANTKQELEDKRAKLREQERQGINIASSSTFGHWAEEWLKNTKENNDLSDGTLGCYRAAINLLNEQYRETKFKQITLNDFQAFINQLAKKNPHTGKPTSKRTLRLVRSVAESVAKYASGSHVDGISAFYYVIIPNTAPTKERPALNEEQVRMVQEFHHPAQLFAMLATFAGLRRGEALGLHWRDIDFKNKLIHVKREVIFKGNNTPQIKKGGKTKNAVRVIAVPPVLVNYLKSYRHSLTVYPGPGAIVCCNKDGNYMSQHQFSGMWNRYQRALNRQYGDFGNCNIEDIPDSKLPQKIERFTPHQCRHFYATLVYLNGLSIGDAMSLMGHSDPQVTMAIYTDLKRYSKWNLSKDFQEKLATEYKIEKAG